MREIMECVLGEHLAQNWFSFPKTQNENNLSLWQSRWKGE
jgi:hypothetical protein